MDKVILWLSLNNIKLSFLVIASLELIAVSEMEECCKAYIYAANRREEQWRGSHTCGAGVPPKTGFSFSFASRIHLHSALPITVFTYEYDTRAQIFSARPISNVRFVRFVIFFTWKSDFPQLCVKRVVVATAESSLFVSQLGKSHQVYPLPFTQ